MTTRFCLFAALMFALGCCTACDWGVVTSGPAEVGQAPGSLAATELDSPAIDIVPPRPSPIYSKSLLFKVKDDRLGNGRTHIQSDHLIRSH